MANCNDVAKLAGVSRQTVSRVINNTGAVTEETRNRVLAAIEQLNYYPNFAARSLKSTKSRTIGFIIPDAFNDFYMRIAIQLQEHLKGLNYGLVILFSNEDERSEEKCLSILIEQRVELLLFTPAGMNEKFLQLIERYRIPVIQLFRFLYPHMPSVTIDDEFGSYLAACRLLSRGHRRILLIEEKHDFESLRLRGLKRALAEHGIPFTEEMYFRLDKGSSNIEQIGDVLKKTKPTAVIPVAKYAEIALLKTLVKLNYEVNKDIEIVFYDDNETARLFDIPVVTHNFDEVTDKIVELIRSCLKDASHIEHIILKPFIEQRDI